MISQVLTVMECFGAHWTGIYFFIIFCTHCSSFKQITVQVYGMTENKWILHHQSHPLFWYSHRLKDIWGRNLPDFLHLHLFIHPSLSLLHSELSYSLPHLHNFQHPIGLNLISFCNFISDFYIRWFYFNFNFQWTLKFAIHFESSYLHKTLIKTVDQSAIKLNWRN